MNKYREIFKIIEENIQARMIGRPWQIQRLRAKLYAAVLDYGLTPDEIVWLANSISEGINPDDPGSIGGIAYDIIGRGREGTVNRQGNCVLSHVSCETSKPRLYLVKD
jgi:hypothetical protein